MSRRDSDRGASAMALLVAAHIHIRGIRYLQLSNSKTRGTKESLVPLSNAVVDTPITLAIVAEPLRHLPTPCFLTNSIVKGSARQSICSSYSKHFSLATADTASIK